jgi:ligand-binding sensor domain-containing protein
VALYDREHDRFKRFLPNPGQTAGNNVRAVIEDRQGQIWLGTNNGVAHLDPETGTITRFPLIPDSHTGALEGIVGSLFEDREGRLWVGSVVGLLRFDRRLGQYTRWPGPNGELAALNRVEIGDIFEDKDGALWVATMGEGLHRVDVSTGRGTRYLPDPDDPDSISTARVRRLVPDGQGRLYVGTENAGLDILDLTTRKFAHNRPDPEDATSLRSGSIWSMRLDDQGILWIGTFNNGVDCISPSAQRFQSLRARRGGLSDSHVSAVLEDRLGNLWIGTDGGGLNRLDRKTGTFRYYRHDAKDSTTIGSNAVWALLEDSQRRLWVGGWDGGLGLLDPASGRVTRFRHDPADPKSITSDNVWRILELSTGELLVVTHAGADLFDPRSRVFTRVSELYPGASRLYSAAEDGQGNIWLAGSSFIDYVDRRKGSTTRHPNDPQDPGSLGVGWAQAVSVDSAGNVWLGSERGLTCVVANTKEVRRYTTSDGLPDNSIANIVEDHSGNLWLGTNRGVSKLVDAVRLPRKPIFLNFDVHDGLQGNEFTRNASFVGRSGAMYIGGSGGLNSFDPERIQRNSYVPPVVLTGFKIFNKTVPIAAPGSPLEKTITETRELTLSYQHSMVTFEFAALNFVLPQKNQYAYKLEGFDDAWNEVGGQRSATYTNLPHGAFTLRVRGSNNDGVWNDQGVSLAIRVRPPFWRANWFFVAVALTLVGAAGGVHRLRIRQHIRAERQLQERVTTALADIRTLRGLLPICAWCKKIRDDSGYWNQLEEYVSQRTDAEFSHGICPECMANVRKAP